MADLLEPFSLSGLTLRNRIVMPPLWSGQATPDGAVTESIIEYHRVRAAAGCGLVIVEHAFVHPHGRHTPTQIGIHDDAMLGGLRRLTASVRAEGAAVASQLAHAGSKASSGLIGRKPLGPSPVPVPGEMRSESPDSMTLDQIEEAVAAFGQAAARAVQAGFDAVEIHAAHGFLLSEFLSPLTNTRNDEFGGSEENRCRLHLEILREVRRRVGSGFPIFIRLGVDDDTEGGIDLDAACRVAGRLVENGADLIDVSGGLQGPRMSGKDTGYFVPHAQAIRTQTGKPVIVAGGIREPVFADAIVREGRADLVAIGRAMLEDPQWARRAIAELSRSR